MRIDLSGDIRASCRKCTWDIYGRLILFYYPWLPSYYYLLGILEKRAAQKA